MVPVEHSNPYSLRNFILDEIKKVAAHDPLKQAFLVYLDLIAPDASVPAPSQVYMRCAVSGLNATEKNTSELARLLGQASYMDGTPMPWVSDIWSVLGIKWAVDNSGDTAMIPKFTCWVNDFLPKQIKEGRLSLHEKAIAEYILTNELSLSSASCVVLFLHYKGILPLQDQKQKEKCLNEFYADFKDLYKLHHSKLTLALFVYVFDAINRESAAVPPHMWGKEDIIQFLENLPIGLKRWTWEEKPRTKNSSAVKWMVENEYHVQNLLYIMLGPIFPDIADEVYTNPVGQKTPRIDIHLPSINTIIEVKYRKDSKKSFQDLIGEIAEDASLYRADARFRKCTLIFFLWDHTRSTQEHTKFKEGTLRIPEVDGCVVVCSPSLMT